MSTPMRLVGHNIKITCSAQPKWPYATAPARHILNVTLAPEQPAPKVEINPDYPIIVAVEVEDVYATAQAYHVEERDLEGSRDWRLAPNITTGEVKDLNRGHGWRKYRVARNTEVIDNQDAARVAKMDLGIARAHCRYHLEFRSECNMCVSEQPL